jgi:hypothetical protein
MDLAQREDRTLDRAVPMLEKAARGKVEGLVGARWR